MSQLPKGWELKTFGDVLSLVTNGVNGKQNKEGVGVPVSRIETIADQKIDLDRIGYLESYDEEKIEKYRLQENDILFSHINSALHLGKTAIVPSNVNLYHGVNLLRLAVNELAEPRYFNYYCKYFRLLGEFSAHAQHAVNQSSLNQKKLKAFNIPLAPMQQQKRIVDKLDSVLAKVEAAQARLDKIPTILKRFRQSVLAAATSGELTKDWREEHHEAFKKVTLGNAGVIVKTGPFGSALHKSEYIMSGIPVVNPTHISEGKIFPSESMTITPDKFEDLKSWNLKIGDVIVGRRGEMGRAAEIKEEHLPMLCGTGSMIIRTEASGISPAFLTIALRSPTAIQFFESNSVGSTMVNLNQKIIKAFEIYYPSDEEQTEIVSRVNQLFEHANTVEKQYNAAKAYVDKLTQSILAKAFRGELLLNEVDTDVDEALQAAETVAV